MHTDKPLADKEDWKDFWKDAANKEGGEISLTTLGIIVGL